MKRKQGDDDDGDGKKLAKKVRWADYSSDSEGGDENQDLLRTALQISGLDFSALTSSDQGLDEQPSTSSGVRSTEDPRE